VLLYDIPSRTGREIDVDTLVTLSEIPNIIGVKDATGRVDKAADVIAATRDAPGGFDVWSGADEVNLPLLSVGAVGVVSVAAHLAGPEIAEMVTVHASDPVRARDLHLACMPLHRALFLDPNPGPLKAALGARGLPAGPVRLPLVDASPEIRDRVLAALSAIESHRPV
jgi:4-hydroxy-tetrahydrodipicolinate synthase